MFGFLCNGLYSRPRGARSTNHQSMGKRRCGERLDLVDQVSSRIHIQPVRGELVQAR